MAEPSTLDTRNGSTSAQSDVVFLIGVNSAHAEQFRVVAREHGLLVEVSEDPRAISATGLDPCLCVMGIGRGQDAVLDQASALPAVLPGVPIVVIGGDLEARQIAHLGRLGVEDVISCDLSPREAVARSLESRRTCPGRDCMAELVGESRPMRSLRSAIRAVASTNSTVLLTGETGVGKGLVARMIHECSNRRNRRFVHVDAASLSPTVVESELFGHERGAFTGAVAQRTGRFELAQHSTIFLDEIGNLTGELQAKLLRVLQDREFERLGGSRTIKMTARVVTATNVDLARGVDEGRFRADLFYRLNVFHLRIPSLRERGGDDIAVLAETMIGEVCRRLGVPVRKLSDVTLRELISYEWPGNVRELMNVLERIALGASMDGCGGADLGRLYEHAASGPAAAEGLAPIPKGISTTGALGNAAADLRRILISTGGNVSRAARRLQIPRSTLRYRIRKHGLEELVPTD